MTDIECVVESTSETMPHMVTLRVITGDPSCGDVLVKEGGGSYCVASLALAGWKLHAAGLRLVSLSRLDGTVEEHALRVGDRLRAPTGQQATRG